MDWLYIILGLMVGWGLLSLFRNKGNRGEHNNIHNVQHESGAKHEHRHGHGGCCH